MHARPVLVRASLVLAGIMVGALVAELVLRVLGVGHFVAFRGDPETGVQHVAAAEGWFRDEGEAYVRINSAGFRDVERSIPKPAGTFRVAVLGDSFTEGFQVAQERTFTAVAERELRSCARSAGRHVEVLNFGVSSYGTAQELILLRSRVLAYEPDLIVAAFYEGNDVLDNSLDLSRSPERPYFVERDGELSIDTGHQRFAGNRPSLLLDAWFWLMPRLRLVQLVQNARSSLIEPGIRAEVRAAHVPGGLVEEWSLARGLFREPTDPAWSAAWSVTERLLREMRNTAALRGASFVTMVIPVDVRAHPNVAERERVARQIGVADLQYQETRLSQAAARDGYELILLSSRLADHAVRTGEHLYGTGARGGHGHFNELGHRLTGEVLGEELCARLMR